MDHRITFDTSAGFWFSMSLLVLLLPLPWLVALILSCFVHEVSHIIAVFCLGADSCQIRFRSFGIYLDTDSLTPRQEMLTAISGPLGGLSLLLFRRWLPKTALCAVFQACFHLLPIFPLDGGRALKSWFRYIGFDGADLLSSRIEKAAWIILISVGLYFGWLLRSALIAIGIGICVILRTVREKYLAKRRGTGYNICTKI